MIHPQIGRQKHRGARVLEHKLERVGALNNPVPLNPTGGHYQLPKKEQTGTLSKSRRETRFQCPGPRK